MEKLLREKGYRVTPARLCILDTFARSKNPESAKGIYRKILKMKKRGKLDKATVYRTLASFENSGILKRVNLRKEAVFFELNEVHHHHIVCTNCEKIEDFENSKLEKILGRIVEYSSGFIKIKEHSLELFGVCRECA